MLGPGPAVAALTRVQENLIVFARAKGRKKEISVAQAGGIMNAARIAASLSHLLLAGMPNPEVEAEKLRLCRCPPSSPAVLWTPASAAQMDGLSAEELQDVEFAVPQRSSAAAAEVAESTGPAEMQEDSQLIEGDLNEQLRALCSMEIERLREALEDPQPQLKIDDQWYDRCTVQTALEEPKRLPASRMHSSLQKKARQAPNLASQPVERIAPQGC